MGCGNSKSSSEEPYGAETEHLSLITNFSQEELNKVYNDFKEESPTGQLNREQFDEFYTKFFKKSKDEDKAFVDHLFRTFDFNSDGQINFKEFICGVSVTSRGTLDEKLTWSFNVYDVNNDGTITYDEMGEIMRAIYAFNGITEPEQVDSGKEAFKGLDSNGDGLITVAEFVKGAKRDKRLLKMLDKSVADGPTSTF